MEDTAVSPGPVEAYLRSLGLWDVEHGFSRSYVSNPGSGEIVKGHRMVLAELGRRPQIGDEVRAGDVAFQVLAVQGLNRMTARALGQRAAFDRLASLPRVKRPYLVQRRR